jgi:hypothetical protein
MLMIRMSNLTFWKIGIVLVTAMIFTVTASLTITQALSPLEQVNISQERNESANKTGNQTMTNTTAPQAFP